MLGSVPRLNPEVRWEELEDGAMMAVYRKHVRGPRLWLMKLLHIPETTQLVLDDAGTRVVRAIDGARTVNDLIAHVASEFRLSRKESEVSLLRYMEMLGKRGLVGFAVGQGAGERP